MDHGASSLVASQLLQKLNEHDQAWSNMNWTQCFQMPMRRGGLYELYGGVWVQTTAAGALIFSQLPSIVRGIEQRQWDLRLEFPLRDLGIDPGQDLLVLVQQVVVFVASSTFQFYC